MSTLGRAEHRGGAVRPMAAVTVDGHVDEAGVYLTDEVFLYRVVGPVAGELDELVELEDCYRLDIVRVPIGDLQARRLRVVTPAAADRGR